MAVRFLPSPLGHEAERTGISLPAQVLACKGPLLSRHVVLMTV